jgi:23S rRNA pseudouridine1911/1915/1917 synthase
MRIDAYLAAVLHSFSRTLIQRWLEAGQVTVGGVPVRAGRRVHAGDAIRLVVPHPPAPPGQQVVPAALTILLDRDGVLACHKPVGQLAHPAGRVLHGTLLNQVQELLASRGLLAGTARLVNRIDRDTSGIVLATADTAVHASLCAELRAGGFTKEYLAICHGVPAPAVGDWLDPIVAPEPRTTIARHCGPGGQPSHTSYSVVAAAPGGGYALLRLRLHTGRQHQIRVHAAHHGHPLVGDWAYGAPCQELAGQALHATRLDFTHPVDGRRDSVTDPLDGRLAELWTRLAAGGEITPRNLRSAERQRLGRNPPPDGCAG